ncbi:MAG: DMT family transporter [Rhodospirillaceae bacterium]|jgi:drug/metabolite transporter (DMT)-like permease|nr:DMT family transporter [Rhodospirillaceae bacterium]MBT5050436.1 DMT family transporter [Rhodospirillaceae bacterium]MBT5458848.1 DMT family transporter [Rhodospirillaceae bacterium]
MSRVAGAIARFTALPGSTRGIFWMISATIFYAAAYATIRHLSTDMGVFQLVFFRSFLGVILMAPWLIQVGVRVLRTDHFGAYSVRTMLNYGGMVLLIFALSSLPLQDVTALMFTSPLFTVIFVVFFLGEKAGPRRWAALFIGFFGVLIIVRPGFQELTWAAIGILGTSAAYALVNVSTKTLARTDSSNKIVYYDFLLMSAIGLVPAIMYWSEVRWEHVIWIVAMGVFSSLARQGVIRALAEGEASIVMPFNFLKLPFTVCLGFVFFAENPDIWTGAGAAVIFASSYYIARREAALKAVEAAKPAPTV